MHSNCCLAGFQKLESGIQDFYPRFLWPRILIFCYVSYDANLARIGKKQSVITNTYCYLQVVWLGGKSHAQEEAGWGVDQEARFSWDTLFCCGFVCQLTNELIGSSPLSRASSSSQLHFVLPHFCFLFFASWRFSLFWLGSAGIGRTNKLIPLFLGDHGAMPIVKQWFSRFWIMGWGRWDRDIAAEWSRNFRKCQKCILSSAWMYMGSASTILPGCLYRLYYAPCLVWVYSQLKSQLICIWSTEKG